MVHVQRFYRLGLHKALLWVQMSCITVTEIVRSLYSVCVYIFLSIRTYVNDILFSVCESVRECIHIGVCAFVRCSLSNDSLLPFLLT